MSKAIVLGTAADAAVAAVVAAAVASGGWSDSVTVDSAELDPKRGDAQ